jgi:hypothetical protein
VIVAIYDDTLRRTPDGWRISERYCRRIGPSIVSGAPGSVSGLEPIIEGVSERLDPSRSIPMVVDALGSRA